MKETERELLAGHNLLSQNVVTQEKSRKITIVTKGRSYVMQGQVKKYASSGIRSRAREYTFYLFSDVLIYANKIIVENETQCEEKLSDLIRIKNPKRRKARKYKEQLEHEVREKGKKELEKGIITQDEYESMLSIFQDTKVVSTDTEDVTLSTDSETSKVLTSPRHLKKSSSSRRDISKSLSKYGLEYQKSSYLRKRHRRNSYVYGHDYGLKRRHLRGVMYIKHAEIIASSTHTRDPTSPRSKRLNRNTDKSGAYEKDPTRFAIRVPGKTWELKLDSAMIARRWVHQLRDCIAALREQDEGQKALPVCSGLGDVKVFGLVG